MEREGSIRNAVVTVSKNRDITARKMWYRDHFLIGKDAIHLRNENSDILPGARSWPTYEYLLNTISGHFCEIVCIPVHSGVTYFFVIFARWFYSLPSRGDGGRGIIWKIFAKQVFPAATILLSRRFRGMKSGNIGRWWTDRNWKVSPFEKIAWPRYESFDFEVKEIYIS